ncbi:GNAT family N-acetyltransferase [Streptomyces sp. NPDC004732]|uniref:GNAT family N-acetyltransferase n=1 Tax=Streptomyces sp. NPDC004732 TaxID=3154290 RepID=UPI0033AB04C0
MATVIEAVSGSRLLSYAEGIRTAYVDAFGGAPWGEGPEHADGYLRRLAEDVHRPGFTAALALDGDREGGAGDGEAVLGWATAWTTPRPFPTSRCYPQISAALGEDRTAAWLCGAREVDELAVASRARGTGAGSGLLDAVTRDRADGRCWLLTSVAAGAARTFYERAGWTPVTHPAAGGAGLAAYLGPRHPAGAAAPRPL